MAKTILYFAHPGQVYSVANKAMFTAAKDVSDLTIVDLYAEYPRHDIDIDKEQQRLLDHDVIIFQFPLFWYSSPSIVKEWLDLVLEHGFAYGDGGDKLSGKKMMLAVTCAGSEDAYTENGYQNFPLRTFLTPLEQTARLSKMTFVPPYVLYGSLAARGSDGIEQHVDGYSQILSAIIEDRFDFDGLAKLDFFTEADLPIFAKAT